MPQKYCSWGCDQLIPPEINKYFRGADYCESGIIKIIFEFLKGHEWERARKSPCGACPDRDGQLLQGSEESEEASRRDGEDVEGLGLGNTRRQSQFPADTQWMTQQNQT
jgi:hypothetical protein